MVAHCYGYISSASISTSTHRITGWRTWNVEALFYFIVCENLYVSLTDPAVEVLLNTFFSFANTTPRASCFHAVWETCLLNVSTPSAVICICSVFQNRRHRCGARCETHRKIATQSCKLWENSTGTTNATPLQCLTYNSVMGLFRWFDSVRFAYQVPILANLFSGFNNIEV